MVELTFEERKAIKLAERSETKLCRRCGKPLTDLKSRKAGIGPICAQLNEEEGIEE